MSFDSVATLYADTAVKYRDILMKIPIIGLDRALQHMTLRSGIQWKEITGSLRSSGELKPHDGELRYQDTLSPGNREIEVFPGDYVELFFPESLRKTILGKELVGKTSEAPELPIEAQVLAAVLMSVSGKLALHIFDAARDVSNMATAKTKQLFNGFDTIALADKTAGKISVGNGNYKLLESITSANAVDLLKTGYQACSDELRETEVKIFIPWSVYDAYNEDYKATTGAIPYNTEYKKTFLEGSNNLAELVPLKGKKDSRIIQITPASNMIVGVDQISDTEQIRVREVENPWKLQLVMKALFGVQYDLIDKEVFMLLDQGPAT